MFFKVLLFALIGYYVYNKLSSWMNAMNGKQNQQRRSPNGRQEKTSSNRSSKPIINAQDFEEIDFEEIDDK